MPEARARVHQQRDAGRARGRVRALDRLQRAHLAVGVLQRGQGHARMGDGRAEGVLVDATGGVDRHRHAMTREVGGVQHGRSLDGPDDDVGSRAPATAGDRAHGRVQGRRVRRREVDVLRPGSDDGRDRLARTVEQHACAATLGVQPAWIRPPLVERLQERSPGLG